MRLLTLLRAGLSLLAETAWPPSPPRYLEPLDLPTVAFNYLVSKRRCSAKRRPNAEDELKAIRMIMRRGYREETASAAVAQALGRFR